MYRKILVPLDGSATAEAVLPYVEAFAQGFKCAVELISIIDTRVIRISFAGGETQRADEIITAEEKRLAAYLQQVAVRLERYSPESRILRGTPENIILETAANERDTLVAMASHGRSGVKRWLMGSVAEKVLRGASNPLFLVRAAAARTSPQKIINSIIVPLDGSPLAEKILPAVSSWARALDLEVALIRACEFPDAAYLANMGLLRPDYEALRTSSRTEAADYLKAKEDSLVAEGVRTVSTVTLEGPAADEIIGYGQTAARAMIAMSTHGRSGVQRWMLGSVTEKVVRHGDDPVLVVRGG
jgi:nucleotide-binding universal stress UspA family protein